MNNPAEPAPHNLPARPFGLHFLQPPFGLKKRNPPGRFASFLSIRTFLIVTALTVVGMPALGNQSFGPKHGMSGHWEKRGSVYRLRLLIN